MAKNIQLLPVTGSKLAATAATSCVGAEDDEEVDVGDDPDEEEDDEDVEDVEEDGIVAGGGISLLDKGACGGTGFCCC